MMTSRRLRRRLRIFFVVLVGLVLAAPLLYLVSASLMSAAEIAKFPPRFIPASIHLRNYSAAWSYLQLRTGLNSVIFVVGAVGLQWIVCISAGLVLAKMRYRANNKLVVMFAVSLFLPAVTTLVPTFVVTNELHLVNTYPGLILPIAAQTGFGTLMFRQFIVNMPDALLEAARLDGAGWLRILVRIVIPLTKPATAAYAAISVLTAWNMYLWPLVVATRPSVQVLTESLGSLSSSAGFATTITENVAFAATVITTLPMLFAFLFAQGHFVRGLAGSGVE